MKPTVIVAALFATALIGASTLPAAATKNTDYFSTSAEGNKGGGICTDYLEMYKDATKAMQSKNKELSKLARDQANSAINTAYKFGCAWVDAV